MVQTYEIEIYKIWKTNKNLSIPSLINQFIKYLGYVPFVSSTKSNEIIKKKNSLPNKKHSIFLKKKKILKFLDW